MAALAFGLAFGVAFYIQWKLRDFDEPPVLTLIFSLLAGIAAVLLVK